MHFLKYLLSLLNLHLLQDVRVLQLLKTLHSTDIKVGLDVLEGEIEKTLIYKDLINFCKKSDKLIITPHLGGSTIEARLKRSNYICKLLYKWCSNEN